MTPMSMGGVFLDWDNKITLTSLTTTKNSKHIFTPTCFGIIFICGYCTTPDSRIIVKQSNYPSIYMLFRSTWTTQIAFVNPNEEVTVEAYDALTGIDPKYFIPIKIK